MSAVDLTDPAEEFAAEALGAERRRVGTNLIIGGLIVLAIVGTALLSFVWTPHDPTEIVIADRLKGAGWEGEQFPSRGQVRRRIRRPAPGERRQRGGDAQPLQQFSTAQFVHHRPP